ncbi:A24 family peptidase [Micromonospora profundi]|uniref:prepilin peptidase n=1 Tax=Micromonospora profundi TaxID=1420889 RepID=UPI0033A2E29C
MAALLPSGRCGWCRQRIGARPYLLELCIAVAATIVVLAAPTIPVLLAGLWWAGCAVPLVFIDTRVHRLPDVLTMPAAAGVLALLTVDAAVGDRWDHLLSAAVCAAVTTAVFVSMGLLLGSRGMGLGDAKLTLSATALLGWWGWGAAFGAVFLGFLGAGFVGVALLASGRVHRGTHIPMGPFFIAGTVVMLALVDGTPAK